MKWTKAARAAFARRMAKARAAREGSTAFKRLPTGAQKPPRSWLNARGRRLRDRADAAARSSKERTTTTTTTSKVRRTVRQNPAELLTITNPGGKERAAVAALRRFHGEDVRVKRRALPPGLPDLVSLGLIEDVAYRPRKGERSGPRGWVHRFGRGAVLAAPISGKGPLYVIPAKGRPFRVDWERGIVG